MKETEEKGYSPDGEHYFNNIDDFLCEFSNSGIHEIYEAKKKIYTLSDFINTWSIFDKIVEDAFEEVSGAAEYFQLSDDQYGDSFKKMVDLWAKKEGIKINFWGIHSERKIKIKVDVEKSEYEILRGD